MEKKNNTIKFGVPGFFGCSGVPECSGVPGCSSVLVLEHATMECLFLGTIGLIVAPWKFDVLKTSIFALEVSLLGQIFSNIFKLPRGNYQPIVPRQKHSIV